MTVITTRCYLCGRVCDTLSWVPWRIGPLHVGAAVCPACAKGVPR